MDLQLPECFAYVAIATIACILITLGWNTGFNGIFRSPWKRWYSSIPGPPWSPISPFTKVNFFGREMSKKYGPVYKIWHNFTPVIILSNPEDVRTFFKDQLSHKREAKYITAPCVLKELMGGMLGLIHGKENFKFFRGIFDKYFSSSAVRSLQPLIGQAADQCVTALSSVNELNLYDGNLVEIAFKVVSTMCYGEEATWRHLEYIKSMKEIQFDIILRAARSYSEHPIWQRITGNLQKAKEFTKIWKEFHHKLLQERENGIIKSCDGFFFALWDSMQTGDCQLTESQLLDTVNEILLLDMEASQAVMATLLADIARQKHVQRRLLEEIDNTIGCNDVALVEDLSTTLPYLHKVMTESARMWPLMSLTFPEITVKDATEIGGYIIPKDTTVCIDPYTLHYDPVYWPDPEKFDPDRFSKDAEQSVKPNTFFQFGFGPRKCLGYRLAPALLAITVVKILQKYEVGLMEENSSNIIMTEGIALLSPYLAPNITLKHRKARGLAQW